MATVLLVEDNEEIRRIYTVGLEQEGFKVNAAESAGQALATMAEEHFDVIVMDVMLTGMSGLDLLSAYPVKKESPGTKVVVFTNFSNEETKQKAEDVGVDGFLLKTSYDPKKLGAYLRDLLKSK